MSTKHTKHTQGKWHIDAIDATVINDKDWTIAFTARKHPKSSGAEIAAHIVRCVNSHESLLAALKAAHEEMLSLQLWAQECRTKQHKINPDALWSKLNSQTWGSQARAAIAAAESN